MIERRLSILILIYLWAALLEDTLLFLMSWLAPDLWFLVFHSSVPAGLEVAFLRPTFRTSSLRHRSQPAAGYSCSRHPC